MITFMDEHPDFDDRYAKLNPEQREELIADLRRRLSPETEVDLNFNVVALKPHG